MGDSSPVIILLLALCVLWSLPFVVYRCSKLIVYGALVARMNFERNYPKEKSSGKERS